MAAERLSRQSRSLNDLSVDFAALTRCQMLQESMTLRTFLCLVGAVNACDG